MTAKKIQTLVLFLGLLVLGCKEKENDQQQTTELDIDLTTNKVELFAEGIVSTDLYERDIAISPKGNELIYSLGDYKQNKRCLVQIQKVNGNWSEPEILNISGEFQDIEPFFTKDGQRLFFASNRPMKKSSGREDYNIWYSDKNGEMWSEPKALNEKINTEKDEFFPSLSKNGNLYFTTTREDGIGREDIFVSKKINGEYQVPSVLDRTINTEFFEFNAYVSPDENLLIFSSFGRSDGYGGGDLYFSIRDRQGKWSKAQNMGQTINSTQLDYCPFVDMERKNLYFTSERLNEDSAKINSIEDLKAFSNKTQNGTGNIYKIGMEELKLN